MYRITTGYSGRCTSLSLWGHPQTRAGAAHPRQFWNRQNCVGFIVFSRFEDTDMRHASAGMAPSSGGIATSHPLATERRQA
jgi:hypothetical protein